MMIEKISPRLEWRLLVPITIAALVFVWLGVAWFCNWFPFSYDRATPPQVLQEKEILNSLTATGTPTETATSTLKELTAGTSATSAITTSILDSLTPKK